MRDDRQGSKRTSRNSRGCRLVSSLLNERISYRIVHFQSTRFFSPTLSPNFSSLSFLFFPFSRSREVVEPILIRLRPVEKRVQRRKVRDRKVREFLYLPGILIYKYAPASRNPLFFQNFFPQPSLERTSHPALLTLCRRLAEKKKERKEKGRKARFERFRLISTGNSFDRRFLAIKIGFENGNKITVAFPKTKNAQQLRQQYS